MAVINEETATSRLRKLLIYVDDVNFMDENIKI